MNNTLRTTIIIPISVDEVAVKFLIGNEEQHRKLYTITDLAILTDSIEWSKGQAHDVVRLSTGYAA